MTIRPAAHRAAALSPFRLQRTAPRPVRAADARIKILEEEVHQLRGVTHFLANHLVKYVSVRRRAALRRLSREIAKSRPRGNALSYKKQTQQLLASIFDVSGALTSGDTTDPAVISGKRTSIAPAEAGVGAALARGVAAKTAWVRECAIVPAKALGAAWDMTPQGLGRAAERGELFSLKVNNRLYYPAGFLSVDRESVAVVTSALGLLSPSEKLVFWMRPHGSLGGKTVAQALEQSSNLADVTQLAAAWAAEAGAARAVA